MFDLAKGMRIAVSFTYQQEKKQEGASVIIRDITVTDKALESVGVEYVTPIFEMESPKPPTNPYLPGAARKLRIVGSDSRRLLTLKNAMMNGDSILIPCLWPKIQEQTSSSLFWVSQKTYHDLMVKSPTPWALPAGMADSRKLVSTKLNRDALDGFFNLLFNGRLLTVTAIRAHDDLQNYYLILENPRNPLVLSVRYGLYSDAQSMFAGGGYDVKTVNAP